MDSPFALKIEKINQVYDWSIDVKLPFHSDRVGQSGANDVPCNKSKEEDRSN